MWFQKFKEWKAGNRNYTKLFLKQFLGRNPDPKILAEYAQRIARRATAKDVIRRISQNQEYLSHFSRKNSLSVTHHACAWNDNSYKIYTNGAKIDSIVIVKLDHIGDFILALDSILALRRAFSSTSITLLCGPWNAALAKSFGIFDRVETMDFFATIGDSSRLSQSEQIPKGITDISFDLAIDLRVDPDSRIVLDYLSATYKCGYTSGACRSCLTVAMARPDSIYSDSLANNQRMLMLNLAHAVVDFFQRDAELTGEALRKTIATAEIDLSFREGKPLVAIHPFSGRSIKNWPIENFMRLATWLTGEMGAFVVVLGTRSEADSQPHLCEMCASAHAKSLVGETSLPEAISVISNADVYVGNDSGLTHVAARMDIPTVAIYSGVIPIEAWAPYGRNTTIIHKPVACAPCYLPTLEHCPADHSCIRAIDFEIVRAEVRKRLAARLDNREGAGG
jgi:ADP-heptose:LPS heptosyltransferase